MARHVEGKDWISIVDDFINWSIKYRILYEIERKFARGKDLSDEERQEFYNYRNEAVRTQEFYNVAANELSRNLELIPCIDECDLTEPIKYLTSKKEQLMARLNALYERCSWFNRLFDRVGSNLEYCDIQELKAIHDEVNGEIARIKLELDITESVLIRLTETKDRLRKRFDEFLNNHPTVRI